MKGLAYSSLRVGEEYWLRNHGEHFEFRLVRMIGHNDFELQDVHTLETYTTEQLTMLGKGPDFEIRPLNQVAG